MQEIENSIWCICLDFTPNLCHAGKYCSNSLISGVKRLPVLSRAKEGKTQQLVPAVNKVLFSLVHNGLADSMVLGDR